MAETRWLRTLIAVEIGLLVLSILASIRLEHTLPAALQTYVRETRDAPVTGVAAAAGTAGFVWLAFKLVSWIGLFRRWRVAPWLYLASWIAVLLLDLVTGPNVQTAVETALDTAWSVVGGAILVLALQALRPPTAGNAGA